MSITMILIPVLIGLLIATGYALYRSVRKRALLLGYIDSLLQGGTYASEKEKENLYCILDGKSKEIIPELSVRLEETSMASVLKKEAELHALQNQINPHFLYNTLEVIRSRALLQGMTDVAEMTESLALQFRYCINNPGDLATLGQELEHVKNYLLIQRYRFGDRFRYEEVIEDPDKDVMKNKLPVMTLQPIIENALMHGINPKIEGGTITMRIRPRGERLHISVEDDGIGMSEATLGELRNRLFDDGRTTVEKAGASNGIAMKNVHQRIKALFGEQYGIEITSTEGIGTTVLLVLPRMRDIDEDDR